MPPERVGVDLPVLLVEGRRRRGGRGGGASSPGGGRGRLLVQVLVAVVDPVRVEVHGPATVFLPTRCQCSKCTGGC